MAYNKIALNGCSTSHGGVCIASATQTPINDLQPIRIGDNHICPIPGHGGSVVVGGSQTVIVEGVGVSRLGDSTSCGATIIQADDDDPRISRDTFAGD